MASEHPKTIFVDLDGVIFKHHDTGQSGQVWQEAELLENVTKKLDEWEAAGHRIIICTGRREGLRAETEEQLRRRCVPYDTLLMGCTRGTRVIINDSRTLERHVMSPRTKAINVLRNEGLKNVDLS